MGTSYKGNTRSYHSIGQNLMTTSNSYSYQNGFFGNKGNSSSNSVRHISSMDNLSTALDFYNKIANGGIEEVYNGGSLRITRMNDGSIITMRIKSHSDGTPAVDINIRNSSNHADIKGQKIHFTLEDKK